MAKKITNHTELQVYQIALASAMTIFDASKKFPKEERYSLTSQIRDASRSVCANIAEGWRRRRYEGAFINKMNEAEGEAAESQVWIEFAVRCGYLDKSEARPLYETYSRVIQTLVGMINHAETWIITPKKNSKE